MLEGKNANFLSESGALELFIFSSTENGNSNRFKKV
jgi:prophage antirepressor-like protein